jgi:hypothetical protein
MTNLLRSGPNLATRPVHVLCWLSNLFQPV